MISRPDYLALLAAVCAAPDDDAPRLVLADWLEENGEPERAIRIRAFCSETWRLNAFHVTPDNPSAWTFLPDGARVVVRLECPPWCEYADWRRGFICGVGATADDWLAHGDAILAAHPVTEVRLTTRPRPGRLMDKAGDSTVGDAWAKVTTEWEAMPPDQRGVAMLSYRWPAVRTWHLPAEPEILTQAAAFDRERAGLPRELGPVRPDPRAMIPRVPAD